MGRRRFSMLSSLISWSFSLIISGLLAREVTHRVRGADYRAVGAAAYLGIGSVWALGLSSSAALIMAAPASLPQSILTISGVIPLSQTLLLWQSMLTAVAIVVLSMAIAYYSAPDASQARSMADMGVTWPESGANFLLCEYGDRAEPTYRALKATGLLVRWWNTPELRTKLRFSVGKPADNDRLVAALRRLL